MKQAVASPEEFQRLVDWLHKQEAEGRHVPSWRRVVFGYDVLFKNCADKTADILEFKPELLAAMEDSKRLDWLSARQLKTEIKGRSDDGHTGTFWGLGAHGGTLREAIDVIRAKEP